MAKNVLKTLLVSFILIFLLSCTVQPTYSRKNIQKAIRNICKDEFDIDVKVRLSGETIWVYAPFAKLITDDGQWNKKAQSSRVKIFLTLGRVFLSMDNPPKFYCLLVSNIEKPGLDTYTIGYIPDMIKFNLGFISLVERDKRVAFLSFPNPSALGDLEGKHIQEYDISVGEFIAYLVRQNLENKFTSPLLGKDFQLRKVSTHYWANNLKVSFDIRTTKPGEGLTNPFDEARRITKEILDIYNAAGDIAEIEINNLLTGDVGIYTPENLSSPDFND